MSFSVIIHSHCPSLAMCGLWCFSQQTALALENLTLLLSASEDSAV